ncbi:unnamed protein product [Periconia digitata]|uniref:ubiquitinyl hydrolase 1 n=1 Tax=Periconia digitata TaxID=1303443 RepID=A0A9W4U4F5_9PLEO|nr:unnamed protein product [Periconia digitata]
MPAMDSSIEYLIHHMVLPGKLPQKDDRDSIHDEAVLDATLEGLKRYENDISHTPEIAQQVSAVASSIINLKYSRDSLGHICEEELDDLLRQSVLDSPDCLSILPLEVKTQNAGIMIYKYNDAIVFEMFELSPLNQEVLTTEGRLVRTFPSHACQVPIEVARQEGFTAMLSNTLAKMSRQGVTEFQPEMIRSGTKYPEIRNTTHPYLVTEFLVQILAAIGQPLEVSAITKNTREDVLWSQADLPWRRSPLWLLVRVVMQLGFFRARPDPKQSTALYKTAMIYILTSLLEKATREPIDIEDADLIHNLATKIDHRLSKLESYGSNIPVDSCSTFATITLREVSAKLDTLWKGTIKSSHRQMDLDGLSRLQPNNDVGLDVPELDLFIQHIPNRPIRPWNAKFKPTTQFLAYKDNTIPTLPKDFDANSIYTYFQLKEIERWVQYHLPKWYENHATGDSAAPKKLSELISSYHKAAIKEYSSPETCPLSLSNMHLTIMDLWMTLDKCANRKSPHFAKYDPAVDVEPLQVLSLPNRNQLTRLAVIESHIQNRRKAVEPGTPSIFSAFGDKDSFAVRQYSHDARYKGIHDRIIQQAEDQRDAKHQELHGLKIQYQQLMTKAETISCQTHALTVRDGKVLSHDLACEKCCLKNKATNLNIKVFEWPLSTDKNIAEATVFELHVPEWFRYWRDTTRYIMIDVMGSHEEKDARVLAKIYNLKNQKSLCEFYENPRDQRIGVVSVAPPVSKTHQKSRADIHSLTAEEVVVANSLAYKYYDKETDTFVSSLSSSDRLPSQCTYKVPSRSSSVQKYLSAGNFAGGLTPNSVVATPSDCPPHMSLNQYTAFSSLPMGNHIRCANILRQIASPSIDLANPETQCLVMDTLMQAGPPASDGSIERAAHWTFRDAAFLSPLLDNMEKLKSRLDKNWESWRALAIFIQVALRALDLMDSVPDKLHDRYIEFIRDARGTAFNWFTELSSKLETAIDDANRIDLYSRSTEIALVCMSTYDVNSTNLSKIWEPDTQAHAMNYFSCSISIQRHHNTASSDDPFLYNILLQSWKRVLYHVFTTMRHDLISEDFKEGLNDAIMINWPDFNPMEEENWSELPKHYRHWIKCQVKTSEPRSLQLNTDEVHYNLLTGEVLVNDSPLARLPDAYTNHKTYLSLFRVKPTHVALSSERGTRYTITHPSCEMPIHLGICKEKADLFVVIDYMDQKFDLVPARVFNGILPVAFVGGFHHWYCHQNQSIIFRPKSTPWPSSDESWTMQKTGPIWKLSRGNKWLVNPTSDTGTSICAIMGTLEHSTHTHITLDSQSSTVTVELPRLHLSFTFTAGQSSMYSREYKGMIVDHNQQIDTLVGLGTKLVLRHASGVDDRVVIIPEGPTIVSRVSNNALKVSVSVDSTSRLHAYRIDAHYGRLIDSGNVHSKLWLCYLHATTSHCLPDPLTAHTGTESALAILRSAAAFSFDVLTERDVKVLVLIANLTPARDFYPRSLNVLQQVRWNPILPYMSQHPEFILVVQQMFDKAHQQEIFFSSSQVNPTLIAFANRELLVRDKIRTSLFRVDGFGAECHKTGRDRTYPGRPGLHSDRASRSFIAAALITREEAALHSRVNAKELQDALRAKHFDKDATVATWTATGLEKHCIVYDAKLLEGPRSLLPNSWFDIYILLAQRGREKNKFHVLIWLSALAFAESADVDVVQMLASLYRIGEMGLVTIPPGKSLQLLRQQPSVEGIQQVVERGKRPLENCPENDIPKSNPKERDWHYKRRKLNSLGKKQEPVVKRFAEALYHQHHTAHGKTTVPTLPHIPSSDTYINTDVVMKGVRQLFRSWNDYDVFEDHLNKVATSLERQTVVGVQVPGTQRTTIVEQCHVRPVPQSSATRHVFQRSPPLETASSPYPEFSRISLDKSNSTAQCQSAMHNLELLCNVREIKATTPSQKRFARDLRSSIRSLVERQNGSMISEDNNNKDTGGDIRMTDPIHIEIERYADETEHYFNDLDRILHKHVNDDNYAVNLTSRLPRISSIFWFRQLEKRNFEKLSSDWKRVIIIYGLAAAERNRAQRIRTLACTQQNEALAEEIRNNECENWNPTEHPEWLLFEIENDFTLRKRQIDIAAKMKDPPSGKNCVMQLNMGEGKSSVIIPIVAAELADGEELVRIVVNKPQFAQMRQTLIAKLGGLMNRQIYQMPFVRTLKPTASDIRNIIEILDRCKKNGGILLILQEHILSFKLMGIETLISGQLETGTSLIEIQQHFDDCSRDIIDESDEVFNTKHGLIYTIGPQHIIEMGSRRWDLIQEVTSLVPDCIRQVQDKHSSSVEVDERGARRVARVRLLGDEAQKMFLDILIDTICKKGLKDLRIHEQPAPIQQAIKKYVRNFELTCEDIREVETSEFWSSDTSQALHILRGLIAVGVLAFTLRSKRWRVDYGPDPNRKPKTRLAVPYRSKDSPTASSEYSHAEVVILLTCLNNYYNGLSDSDLFEAFTHLLKSDGLRQQYENWTQHAHRLSYEFISPNAINLEDRHKCINDIFPSFRYAKPVIDYFLSSIVFPKEMREFPAKLSASGWDLAAKKKHPTTGFSGTADSKHVLPLNMDFLDLEEQQHTDAQVLMRILQDDNTVKLVPPRLDGCSETTDAELFIRFVSNMQSKPSVIIDVGAQILELDNHGVAEMWLKYDKEAQAVVYFNSQEEIVVLDRHGRVGALQTSTFADDLSGCLVYLDEAHTRGTDLKLPQTYQAAITLGAHLTRDRFSQACMRMRKLGKGQSIVICVTEEIQSKILESVSGKSASSINVSDILDWVMSETDADLGRSMPLWATQGRRFQWQSNLWDKAGSTLDQEKALRFQEEESSTIEDRYGPRAGVLPRQSIDSSSDRFLTEISNRCQEFQAWDVGTITFEEERERALNPEAQVEQEREVERPPNMEYATHRVSPGLIQLIKSSKIPIDSNGILPAFEALQWPKMPQGFPTGLLVTRDYIRTVEVSANQSASTPDVYLKPVEWLLSVKVKDSKTEFRRLIIISSFEADKVLPAVRKSDHALLHLYAPRITLNQKRMDSLDLYCIGKNADQFAAKHIDMSDTFQLNIFAGQLWFNSWQDYGAFGRFANLATTKAMAHRADKNDGFIKNGSGKWGLKESPVPFMLRLIEARRGGEGIGGTHMGKMLRGSLLEPNDF